MLIALGVLGDPRQASYRYVAGVVDPKALKSSPASSPDRGSGRSTSKFPLAISWVAMAIAVKGFVIDRATIVKPIERRVKPKIPRMASPALSITL
jgi:hypothetical protein